MEKKSPAPMTPFDELVTSPQLQMLKLILPYTPVSGQQMLAAFIKFAELRETLFLFRRFGGNISAQVLQDSDTLSSDGILDAIKPYLDPQSADALDMILNMRDMMGMAEMMQNASGEDGPSPDPLDMMAGMLSPEQQEAFRTYSSMFSQAADSVKKGDDDHGQLDEQPGDAFS